MNREKSQVLSKKRQIVMIIQEQGPIVCWIFRHVYLSVLLDMDMLILHCNDGETILRIVSRCSDAEYRTWLKTVTGIYPDHISVGSARLNRIYVPTVTKVYLKLLPIL